MKENYVLILDESGTFAENDEKYIIIGGFLFNKKYEKELESKLRPMHSNLCKTFFVSELHGCERKEYFKYLCVPIGSDGRIVTVVMVIDKIKSKIFKNYDRLSFKYNKAIEHLLFGMIVDGYLSENDSIEIKIDNINLSTEDRRNLNNYLPNKYNFVEKIEENNSNNNICLQFADVIVNRFSKKRHISKKDNDLVLLRPTVYTFLEETEQEYIHDV